MTTEESPNGRGASPSASGGAGGESADREGAGGESADRDGADGESAVGEAVDDRPAIRELDQRTVERIAAGEVVERPASAVKELVENALDADASRVSVAVEAGGTGGIRVRDDGVGMTPDQLERAVAQHTTSKIRDIDDLERGVATLGFRGEALYTIGAVSRLTVRSRPRNADGAGPDAGAELTVEGGEAGEVRPAGCPEGTTVEVEDLFFNTPARRKFLRTEATEFDHVNTVVTHYALANPDVAISLEHDGREVFATPGDGDLRSAVLAVYGRGVAEAMLEVDWAPGDPAGDDREEMGSPAVTAVHGLVSHPETNRSNRSYLSTFVNGRYVTASALREGVLDAYGGQLATDRYPFAVLFVEVPPGAVDVNVHPRKMEVRFDDEPRVREAVQTAVAAALLDHGLVRSSAPRGRSAPDEAAVDPGGTADATADTDADAAESGGRNGDDVEAPAGSTPSSETAQTADAGTAPDPHDADGPSRPSPRPWQETEMDRPTEPVDGAQGHTGRRLGGSGSTGDGDSAAGDSSAGAEGATPPSEGGAESDSREDATARDPVDGFTPPSSQRTLEGDEARVDRAFDRLPALRVLGQLHDTYLVAESPDGLVLVDQHAADERVNYERLQADLAGDTPTQALADPVELELTAREAALFEQYREALASLGFHAGRTGERTVEVRSVPAVFDAALDPALLRDALTAFVGDEAEGGRATVDAVADSLLADLACYPSITGNTSLHEGSVADLLEALDGCENPWACPHGRPVLIAVDSDEIADRFERDYPGHGGRRAE